MLQLLVVRINYIWLNRKVYHIVLVNKGDRVTILDLKSRIIGTFKVIGVNAGEYLISGLEAEKIFGWQGGSILCAGGVDDIDSRYLNQNIWWCHPAWMKLVKLNGKTIQNNNEACEHCF